MKRTDISEKGERTRRRIVETARALFHARGYTNTSMDDIVKKSRVTKGNLYYYFRSKEALGRAVVDETVVARFEVGPLTADGDPVQQIVGMFRRSERALTDGRCKGGCLLGNLALEVSDVHDGLRRKLDEVFSLWEVRLETLLETGVRDGVLTADLDPKATARFLVATLEGGILLAKVKRDVAALKACTATVESLLESLRASQRTTEI
jgi:TetR/AcrR family transcriptional repressor of nem operon